MRDHPRVCGEHAGQSLRPTHRMGSSPRMRGTLAVSLSRAIADGIIPAYAGNTWAAFLVFELGYGSSPRMRGTHIHFEIDRTIFGIIPAYAGNTFAV